MVSLSRSVTVSSSRVWKSIVIPNGTPPRPIWLSWESLFLPVLMGIELVMVAGISLVLSVLHTLYHDVEYVVTNLVGAFYFITPVIWHVDEVWGLDNGPAAFWVMMNPMAVFCEGTRRIIMEHQLPDPMHLLGRQ